MAEKPKLIGTERPIPEVRKYSEITNNLVLVIRDDGSYGGWRTELLVEEITGKVEAKFLLCNYCRGMLRDACFYKKDGKQELACSVCVSNDKDKQMADLNRDSVGERQVSYKFIIIIITSALRLLADTLCPPEAPGVTLINYKGVNISKYVCPPIILDIARKITKFLNFKN